MHYAELCKVVHIWYKLVVRVLWRTMDFSVVGKVCMTSNKLRAGAHVSEHNEILLGLRCWFLFIFFASRRNTRAKHHHSRNIADKGGESVVFPVVSLALSSFCSAKYGSLTAEKSSRAQKGQKKKILRVPDIDSFRYTDSRQGGCHLYHGLFLVPVWRCCQSFSPEVPLWCEWIMRCRSEWVALKRTR